MRCPPALGGVRRDDNEVGLPADRTGDITATAFDFGNNKCPRSHKHGAGQDKVLTWQDYLGRIGDRLIQFRNIADVGKAGIDVTIADQSSDPFPQIFSFLVGENLVRE